MMVSLVQRGDEENTGVRQSMRKIALMASAALILTVIFVTPLRYSPFRETMVTSGDTERWKTGRSNTALPIRNGTTGILMTGVFRSFPAVVDDLLEKTIGHMCEGFNVTDIFLYMKMNSPGNYTIAEMSHSLERIKQHVQYFGIKEIDNSRDDLLPLPGSCPDNEFPIDPRSPCAHFSRNAWTQFQDIYLAYLQLLRIEDTQGTPSF
jgi:hypothetical protein